MLSYIEAKKRVMEKLKDRLGRWEEQYFQESALADDILRALEWPKDEPKEEKLNENRN